MHYLRKIKTMYDMSVGSSSFGYLAVLAPEFIILAAQDHNDRAAVDFIIKRAFVRIYIATIVSICESNNINIDLIEWSRLINEDKLDDVLSSVNKFISDSKNDSLISFGDFINGDQR